MKPNKEFEVNLHVTSIEKGKPSRPDYEDEAMTNLTDEGLRELARKALGIKEWDIWGTQKEQTVTSALQQVRDAAKKEEMERAACIAESWDFYYDFIPKSIGPKIARAIRQMEGGK